MKLRTLEPFGIEVTDLPDLSAASDTEIEQIVAAVLSNDGCGILVVRNQDLPPKKLQDALFRFKGHFGMPLKYDRWPGQSPGVIGCPYLALLGNYKARKDNDLGVDCSVGEQIGEFKPAQNVVEEWHTDGSFLRSPKAAIALYAPLHLKDALPPVGAATRFASNARLYDSLDDDEKARLDGLATVHSWESFMRFLEARDPKRPKVTAADIAKKPDMTYPLVRIHPETGQRAFYINPKNTKRVVRLAPGWPNTPSETPPLPEEAPDDAAGEKLVKDLAERIIATGVYAHQWTPGDFVLWDNRQLLHAASPFDADKYERLLFRCEFSGEPVLHLPLNRPISGKTAPLEHPTLRDKYEYHLRCHPGSVAWGYLDANRPAQLIVPNGATVAIDTVTGDPTCLPCNEEDLGNSDEHLSFSNQNGGSSKWYTPPEMTSIYKEVTDRMIPGHILTGPVYVRDAKPGDVLAIDILEVGCRSNWAWTVSRPFGGLLEKAAPAHLRHTKLSTVSTPANPSGVAHPPWGGELPLRPFFGVIGTAPPANLGRQSSIPPRNAYGGNLDLKELVAGTTLFLPVHVDGALLYVGDGHARQGDGECCGTALETCLSGGFRLTVIKPQEGPSRPFPVKAPLSKPRAETPNELITMACAMRFDEAAKEALEEMLNWLGELRPGLKREDAYMLLSVAADVRVTQLCNAVSRGAHVVVDKSVLPPALSEEEVNGSAAKRSRHQ